MKKQVYIETTVVSYLMARPSRNLLQMSRQQMTKAWWRDRRPNFELVASPLVILEARRGDKMAAELRLAMVENLSMLTIDDRARRLARTLLGPGAIPLKAADDATHIALCAVHSIPYLLTWNFRHIANAEIRLKLDFLCAQSGYRLPIICTPEEL
jgi:hypothetical protein